MWKCRQPGRLQHTGEMFMGKNNARTPPLGQLKMTSSAENRAPPQIPKKFSSAQRRQRELEASSAEENLVPAPSVANSALSVATIFLIC